MPRVIVTQENPNLNYLSAEEYGDIEFLTAQDLSPIRNSIHNERVIDALKTKLKNFDPEADFLIPSGSPVVSAAVFMLLGRLGHKAVNLLRWSNRDRTYQLLHLNLQ